MARPLRTTTSRVLAPWRRVDSSVRSWALWRAPRRVVALALAVDVLALLLALPAAVRGVVGISSHEAVAFALLLGGCVAHTEAARWVERMRELDTRHSPYVDLKSVWSFAGLLLLPPGLALVLVAATWVVWWLRVPARLVPHRWAFSGATCLLATVAASQVLGLLPGQEIGDLATPRGLTVVCAAALVRWTVNHGLVCAVIRLGDPHISWWERFRSPGDTLLGLGALAAGVVLAVVARSTPWLVPVLVAPLLVMHRGFLVPQLDRAARTDDKTGLATSARWRSTAGDALRRARRRGTAVGVVMIDLDGFKAVNDRYGHLVGDQVLRAVAAVLRDAVPIDDAVGRFGGEEFVVLLTDTGDAAVDALAERLRSRIAALMVTATGAAGRVAVHGTASLGTALFPAAGADLDDLLLAADAALYEAKAAGRDRVRAARPIGTMPR